MPEREGWRDQRASKWRRNPRNEQELTAACTGLDDKAIEDKITTLVKEAAAK